VSKQTVYLVDPTWEGDREDRDQSVVEEYPDTRDKFDVVEELWRLAGDDERANQIDAILNVVCERPDPVLNTDEITRILALTDGLEEALRAARVVDEHDRVPAEKLPELRARTRWVNLSDSGGRDPKYGVMVAVGGVWRLRYVLKEALDKGLHVALD